MHDMLRQDLLKIPQLTIPVKCDVVNSDRWTGDEINLDKELEGVDETI